MTQTVLAQILRRLDSLERQQAALIRIGAVAEVQSRPYRVRVNIGTEEAPVVTGPLHVIVPRAGSSMIDFSPLEVGEGVLVLAPGGSDQVMFALPSLARGRIELVAPPADARYFSGGLVVGGDVQACANVVLGNVLPGGVSLAGHTHPLVPGSGPPGPAPTLTFGPNKV